MRAAFYCRIGGQGYGFLLPEEADKLREFFAEHQDKPALEKPSSASKIFCRELDIRVPEIVKADMLGANGFQDLLMSWMCWKESGSNIPPVLGDENM